MSTTSTDDAKVSARARLLNAADELFYEQGVHTVGIDRVIERAGVAKASLYNAFGSKDELVRAFLEARAAATKDRMTRGLARYATARERLVGVFEVQAEAFARPTFRGCAFIRTSAESPRGGPVEEVSDSYRRWVRALLRDLAAEAGAADPEHLARQLSLLYDGAVVGAWMDRDPGAGDISRALAADLIDAAIPATSPIPVTSAIPAVPA